ncbi:MAG: helix-turn-helix domain-containing protein, partial [Clostridia bacterium]|nr:helix-turn-helix domain-containing protein [Clostridia bacterium]
MEECIMLQIGKRLRRQREELGLIRENFAEKVGISPQFLAEIENGKKGMSADTLYKICESFNFSADYILFGKISAENIHT